MQDKDKNKKELMKELAKMCQRIAELEARDVEHKKTEHKLEVALHEWRSTFNAMNDAVCLTDMNNTIIKGNVALAVFLDKPISTIAGSNSCELIHGTPGHFPECPFEQMQRSLKREKMELQMENSYFTVTVDPVFDSSSKLVGSIHVIADITERKRAEEMLEMTKFSVDRAVPSIFWIEKDARFIYVNKAACRALGYSEKELLSMTVHDIDPNFQKDIWPKHWKEIKRRHAFTIESMHRRKDGTAFPIEVAINYLKFVGKEYNVAFVTNISRRKRAEEALHATYHKLRDTQK